MVAVAGFALMHYAFLILGIGGGVAASMVLGAISHTRPAGVVRQDERFAALTLVAASLFALGLGALGLFLQTFGPIYRDAEARLALQFGVAISPIPAVVSCLARTRYGQSVMDRLFGTVDPLNTAS